MAAHSDTHLLEQFAALVRELGRYPTASEVQLKRRRDPTFPSQTVYERFGTKADQARALFEYCARVPGFDDVAELCRPFALVAANEDTNDDEADDDVEYGFVYLIKSGRHYKVGPSNAAGRREREIALQLPEKASTVHVIRTDDPAGIEAYWHQRFAEKRLNGEWFALGVDEVRAFKRRKFM
jgi:hypothetical protein